MDKHRHFSADCCVGRFLSGAFTIVELLVVISIIALLISLLLPALQNARSMAQAIKSENNQRQIMLALTTYSHDHDGSLPQGNIMNHDLGPLPGSVTFWPRTLVLMDYVASPEIYFSPATKWGFSQPGLSNPEGISYGPWYRISYGVNHKGAMPQLNGDGVAWAPANLDQVTVPLSEFMILRHVWNWSQADADYGWYRFKNDQMVLPPDGAFYNGRIAATYADGHVESMMTEQLRELSENADWSEEPFWQHVFTRRLW